MCSGGDFAEGAIDAVVFQLESLCKRAHVGSLMGALLLPGENLKRFQKLSLFDVFR